MNIRKILEQNQGGAAAVLLAIIAILVGAIGYRSFVNAGPDRATDKAFYSVDDGRSYFLDDADKISGFDHEGRPAYRAHVFRAADGAPFVGYLERLTPEARERLAAADQPRHADPAAPRGPALRDQEIKKPGDAGWTKRSEPAALRVLDIRAPGGSRDALEPVLPSR